MGSTLDCVRAFFEFGNTAPKIPNCSLKDQMISVSATCLTRMNPSLSLARASDRSSSDVVVFQQSYSSQTVDGLYFKRKVSKNWTAHSVQFTLQNRLSKKQILDLDLDLLSSHFRVVK